jgi:hypothetical protein
LLARFHVQRPDGQLLSGAQAFLALWTALPGWRWLARIGRVPGAVWLMERLYVFFFTLATRSSALGPPSRSAALIQRASSPPNPEKPSFTCWLFWICLPATDNTDTLNRYST